MPGETGPQLHAAVYSSPFGSELLEQFVEEAVQRGARGDYAHSGREIRIFDLLDVRGFAGKGGFALDSAGYTCFARKRALR